MSLTGLSPLITDWIRNGLRWKYLWEPVYRPFEIPARGQVQIPLGEHTFRYPEGVLLSFSASFDNSECGIRYESEHLDTKTAVTVRNITALGALDAPFYVWAAQPPQTLQGVHYIANYKEWAWTNWFRLYLINTGPLPHYCLNFQYTIAVLLEERPPDAAESLLKMLLMERLDPAFRKKLEDKIREVDQKELLKQLEVRGDS